MTLTDEAIAEDVGNFAALVAAVGGSAKAAEIAGTRLKRIEAAAGGDLSKVNAMHVVRLEFAAGAPIMTGPASARVMRNARAAMATPTLRQVEIAEAFVEVKAAEYRHAALCQPERPSPNQERALTVKEMDVDQARYRAEDLRAVYEERKGHEQG